MAFTGSMIRTFDQAPSTIDGEEERGWLAAATLQQVRRAEIQMHGMAKRLAVKIDAKRAAQQAVRAIAPHEIIGLDALALSAVEIDDLRGHAARGRLEGFEPRTVAQAHVRKCTGEALQDRVEPHLRAYLQPHRAVGLRRLAHARRARHAAELVARKAGHERHIEWIIRRERAAVHGVGDAPAPAELHGADIHLVHLRGDDRAVALLDQRAGNAAPAELACKREPDWSAADDQDRRFRHPAPLN